MLKFEGSDRITAEEACQHKYFNSADVDETHICKVESSDNLNIGVSSESPSPSTSPLSMSTLSSSADSGILDS